MSVEAVRVRLRHKLEEAFGVDEASMLMDRPPGGWNDLVTNQVLTAKLDALRHEMHADMAALSGSVDRRLRAQTWVSTTTLLAGMTMAAAIARLG